MRSTDFRVRPPTRRQEHIDILLAASARQRRVTFDAPPRLPDKRPIHHQVQRS